VQRHLQLLQAADLLILQFPLWWFAAPAILKGWLDRVLVYGPMYNSRLRHEHGAMRGKRALLSVTTGSSARACAVDGREGDTRLLLWPLMYSLRYVGFDVMEPHVVHGVRSGLAPERVQAHDEALAAATTTTANAWRNGRSGPPCPSTTASDFEDGVVLRAEATAYSPFIRHRNAG
jgi:NAD(P)H dehydrogenase (quinone)